MDKLKHMKTFVLIVEEGSIVRAAKQIAITKAAASKQLIDLETELNTQLLFRTTRAMRLTEAGRSYYESAKKVLAAVSEADSIVNQACEKPIGTLRIMSHRYFCEKYIVKNIHEFIMLYPDLKLDIELADRFPDLAKENIDILCGIGHAGPDYLVRRKIASVHHVLCASAKYLAQYGMPRIPPDLKNHRYITHSFRKPDNVLLFKNNMEICLNYHVRVNDAQAMLQCALQDIGIIKIYDYFVDDFIRNGRLIEILKEYREQPKAIYIFYQQQKIMQKKIRLFIDFLFKKIAVE